MKYLALMEMDWENVEKIGDLWKRILEERVTGSDKWPKVIFPEHKLETNLPKLTKDIKAFVIYETDKQEHLINEEFMFAPWINFHFVPIVESRKAMNTWLGWKR